MPVHSTYRDGVVRIVVDGDYTLAELRRVGRDALEGREEAVPVLLDMSGASGMRARTPTERGEMAEFVAEQAHRFTRLAFVASHDVGYGLMRAAASVHEERNAPMAAFRSTAEAEAWLLTDA